MAVDFDAMVQAGNFFGLPEDTRVQLTLTTENAVLQDIGGTNTNYLQLINSVKTVVTNNNGNSTTDLNNLKTAIRLLRTGAAYGFINTQNGTLVGYPSNDGVVGTRVYWTSDMVASIDQLLRSLAAAGVTFPDDPTAEINTLTQSVFSAWLSSPVVERSVLESIANFGLNAAYSDMETYHPEYIVVQANQTLWEQKGGTGAFTQKVFKSATSQAYLKDLDPNTIYRVYDIVENQQGQDTEVFLKTIGGRTVSNSLQAFTELIYIQEGNRIFSQKLAGLEENLSSIQELLDALEAIQDLHNRATAELENSGNASGDVLFYINANEIPGSNGNINPWGVVSNQPTPVTKESGLLQAAKDEWTGFIAGQGGKTLGSEEDAVEFADFYQHVGEYYLQNANVFPKATVSSYTHEGENLRTKLNNAITSLSGNPSLTGSDIIEKAQTVLTDMNTHGIATWILDSYTSSTGSGEFQSNITFAINAATAQNDSEKEELRQFMFIFEEYYKSASAILNKITQLIEKIAQGIAR